MRNMDENCIPLTPSAVTFIQFLLLREFNNWGVMYALNFYLSVSFGCKPEGSLDVALPSSTWNLQQIWPPCQVGALGRLWGTKSSLGGS